MSATTAIAPLALDEIDPTLREMLQPTVDRLGYFGEFFGYGGHAPAVLTGFMHYSGALKGALPDDLNEAIALTVCAALGFAYERIQHERLSARLGFAPGWVATLTGRPEADGDLTDAQRAVSDLARAVLAERLDEARGHVAALVPLVGEAVSVAALFQIARFRDVCTIGRLFDMQLPVASIFNR